MIWNYSLSTNTIWTSFDYGEVEADTYEEALKLAKEKLEYDLKVVNKTLEVCGATIEMDFSQIEIKLL